MVPCCPVCATCSRRTSPSSIKRTSPVLIFFLTRSSGIAHRYHYAPKWPQCEAARQSHSSHRYVFAQQCLGGKAVRDSTGCWSAYAFSSYCGLCTWWRKRFCWCCHLFAGGICLPLHRCQATGSRLQAIHLPLWLPCGWSLCLLQMELVKLQYNDKLKAKYHTAFPLSFFHNLVLPSNKYPNYIEHVKRIFAMFSSTYCCEQLF